MGRKVDSAFTLVELIIVVSILAILAVVALIALRGQIFKGNDAKRKADINRIKVAVEEYEKDHNCYPLPSLLSCNPGTAMRPYIDKIPCDPQTNSSYYYAYQDSSCPGWYKVYTNLENTADPAAIPGIGPSSAFNYVDGSANAPLDSSSSPSSPTPTPAGGGSSVQNNFYGCFSGSCNPISWDSARPGPECDPNFQNSSCYGQCGSLSNPLNECQPWQ